MASAEREREAASRRREPTEVRLDPRLWRRLQQEATLLGLSPDEWLEEAVIAKIEDATDVRDFDEAMAEPGERIPLEQLIDELRAEGRPKPRWRAV